MRRFTMALLALLLAACAAEHESDLKEWVQARKALAKPQVLAMEEAPAFAPQVYEAAGQMDPFNVLRLTQVLTQYSEQHARGAHLLAHEKNRHKEALESYPLDSMTMVGSIRKGGHATALLRVNQQIYQVKPGDRLGQNYGQVVHVEENSIRLREVVQDDMGDWRERVTTLDLQEGSK